MLASQETPQPVGSDLMQIKCVLPWPPSVNHAWRSTGRRDGKIILSAEYKAFKKAVGDYVLENRVPRFKLKGALAISMQLKPPASARDFDIDNRVKCCLDALAGAGVIENDKFIDLLLVRRSNPATRGSVFVRIEEMTPPNFCALKHFADQVFSSNLTGIPNPVIFDSHVNAETRTDSADSH
jgi:Holliday junction resolvase RusA-like endonuclease